MTAPAEPAGGGASLPRVLRIRDFRLLWIGEAVSLLGDQFYLIALPWLVLQLTGDPLAVGGVLAVGAVPRASFMLLGGAVTDRLSPQRVMLASNAARMLLVGGLALVVYLDQAHLIAVYALTLAFGLADALFYPAQAAIVPRLVRAGDLATANSVVQGTAQLSLFVGPALAGLVIGVAAVAPPEAVETARLPEQRGLAFALALDAASFLVSLATLARIRGGRSRAAAADGTLLGAVRSLLVSVWSDRTLRAVFGCTLATNLLVVGPLLVGVPTLAHARFVDGALAFGLVMSANGGGTLIGLALAASLPTPAPHRFGPVLVSVISALGIGVALLGLSPTALAAGAVAAGMGVANGYVLIQFVTWLQTRTPPEMLGRMMSLLLFSQVGLLPVSTALTGALLSLHITGLFVGAGALMTGLMLFASRTEAMRGMGLRASVVPGSTLAAE